jgi:hypothetical protein
MIDLSRRLCLRTPLLALPAVFSGAARALEAPSGAIVLTVSGKLRTPNQGERAVFDMAMLEKLPQRSFSTTTPWYGEPHKFTGPLLRDVLAAAGAEGKQLKAVALNDYKVDIPAEDAKAYDIVLARLMDDKPMPVRDKGPLFIIYPFDARPELRNTIYYSRCAWQLKAIEVQ